MNKSKINTIYIISKGRPNCTTAKTLINLNYKGEWFIVCGSNDNTISEYQKNYGKDKILIFDFEYWVSQCDLLDNFGIEKMSSGATPVRNATRDISEKRNEIRHWQFDDDYIAFRCFDDKNQTFKTIKNGNLFEKYLNSISSFAYNTDIVNCGFAVFNESFSNTAHLFAKRVFNAHNLTSEKTKFIKWQSRMNDDLINALQVYKAGQIEYSFRFLNLKMRDSQSEKGGLTDIYKETGTVRKTAYAILIDPKNVKLIFKFSRFHHSVNWQGVCPKLISSKYEKL